MNRRIALLLLIILPVIFSCTEKEPEVEQVIRVESVTISKNTAELTIGETLQLSASVSPSSATNKEISWSSSNPSVASVNASGLVTAAGEGTTIVSASADGKAAYCTVTVVPKISLNKTQLVLTVDDSETLIATVATPGANLTWSSSDPQVATIENGKLTALNIGETTITVSADGFSAQCSVSVKGMEYGKVSITDLRPVEILPVVGQVVTGDKQVYDHIEHLRLAEATRIRDMMWEYGAGNHTREEYQQLMERLVVGMSNECPSLTEEFEVVGCNFTDLSRWENGHSHGEWSILNSIVPNTKRIVEIDAFFDFNSHNAEKPEQIDWASMDAFMDAHPSSIVILGCSAYAASRYDRYHESSDIPKIRKYCRSGRLMFFVAGGNIYTHDGVIKNKVFQKDIETDEHAQYAFPSIANGKNDTVADMAFLVSVGTNEKGDVDQSGIIYSSSCFPVGFHEKVLFSGRAFPNHDLNSGNFHAEVGNNIAYQSSFPTYVNTAMMSVCFQMFAEAKDVFELLDMVRSTCLTDYIRLDGKTQPLQLINPAGLYKKYLTPQNLPESISTGETVSLEKGYYNGVLFSIPGAEVKVNDEWVAFDNKNKDKILAQNPMNLEWRLNGDLLRKMGYTSGQTVEGQVITVDDKWGGLRLEIPMTIKIQ